MTRPVRLLRELPAPSRLPVAMTSFVGRGRELAALEEALATTRLLTLTGPGGCGKTRLALALAHTYPDEAWWVDLAPLADEALVGAAIAQTLGVRPLPGMTEAQAIVAYLAPRRALVVLDNCEHVLGACADVVTALLTAAAQTTVLATSRATLGVEGEADWRVPPLATAEAAALFVERARKARPGIAMTDDVAELCARLDGLPLAIELAAARTRTLSLDQLAERLSDRFALLSRGPRTARERQQTLRASVDWSHDLLAPAEQRLLRRVAVFAGGFTLEAAEAIHGEDGVVDALDALVDQSLVLAEERPRGMRYRLLETVREYGLERLAAAGEAEGVHDRHRDVFLELAETAGPHLESSRQADWLARLEPEAANLAAALEHALRTDPVTALRFCVPLYRFWRERGRFAEAARAQSRALAAAPDAPPALRARVLVTCALRSVLQADFTAAEAHATEALALAMDAGDPATAARARCTIGDALQFSRPALARTELARAAELAREAGDTWALIQAHQVPAFGATLVADHTRTLRLNDAVAALVERSGEPYQLARRWYLAGWVAVNDGRLAEAREAAERARAAVGRVWEPIQEAAADSVEAQVDVWSGQTERVLARLPGRIEAAQHLGAGLMVPLLMGVLAFAELAADRLAEGGARLERMAALMAGRSAYAEAWALNLLAETQRLLGDDRAAASAARAQAVAERFGNRLLAGRARLTLARLAAARGDWTAAQPHALAYLDACAEGGHHTWVPGGLDALGEIAAGLGEHADGVRLLAAAARARADLGVVRVVPEPAHWTALDAHLRETLSDRYDEAAAQGAGLTLADALAWARRARGPRTRPTAGWPALTPTEARIAELAAQGLTNPEIGERMFVTRETVKTHLGHVFAKLGVRNRAELAALAAQRVTGA